MSSQSTYNLAKFDDGLVYFIKENATLEDGTAVTKIAAVVNVRELKEHAQYVISVVQTFTGEKQEYPIHGVYLTPNNILSIAVSHLKQDPSLMSNLERIT